MQGTKTMVSWVQEENIRTSISLSIYFSSPLLMSDVGVWFTMCLADEYWIHTYTRLVSKRCPE